MLLFLEKGQKIHRKDIFSKLVEILYERNDVDFKRGTFRVRGDIIEVFPTYDDNAYRIELFGDEVESLSQIDPLFGTVKQKYTRLPIYPKSHYVMATATRNHAMETILEELAWWEKELEKEGRLVESQRIHQRTRFDLRPRCWIMFRVTSSCSLMSHIRQCHSCTPCGTEIALAKRTWCTTASACLQRWTTVR